MVTRQMDHRCRLVWLRGVLVLQAMSLIPLDIWQPLVQPDSLQAIASV